MVTSVSVENVKSLANKMDDVCVLVRPQREYAISSTMCFTEKWLHADFPNHSVCVPGFKTVRVDRHMLLSGKKKGGGIAVLVNERWCNPGYIRSVSVCQTLNFWL